MAVKKTIQIGHSSLKAKNKKISAFNSARLKKIIKNLADTMYDIGLVGMAAPQIAENFSVFLTHPRSTKNRKSTGLEDRLRVFINPKITYLSREKSMMYEGCGSVPEIFGPVERPREIEVEAFNEKGQKFSLRCDGLLARVILHEYDHLQGVEFIQKVKDNSKLLAQEHYRKRIRNSPSQKRASKTTKIVFKKL